ncbi:Maintenance of ploidy protein mob2 [Tulasnella sp. 419]|nr:Maintenance of ploidy protein mob2 [Tulasnella sp. 418]KAG8966935.1 Maintenance of ploidy protein mob2 [Tulasnella sp. 419]
MLRRSASPLPQGQPQYIYHTPVPPQSTFLPHQQLQQQSQDANMASVEKPLYLCQPFVRAALVTGKFKSIVVLPKYVDVNEWVAVNIFDFYTNLNLFLAVLSEGCTQASCPSMSAGPGIDYFWIDNNRRQLRLPAPTYIDFVTTWIQNVLDDTNLFPTKSGAEFQPNFPSLIKQVYRQLLRIFAHIFYAHYPALLHLHSEGHFNSLFAHFLAFGKEFEILDPRDIRGLGIGELADRWREMGILEA